jgi:hypothetical protein
MTDGIVTDGALADNHAQAAAIWRVREGITESLVRHGAHRPAVSSPIPHPHAEATQHNRCLQRCFSAS